MHRREFLAASLAALGAGTLGVPAAWAKLGGAVWLSAAKAKESGAYLLCGLDSQGASAFEIPLPGRGHAAAAHPLRAEAVAFARRPGLFALVIDCAEGREIARLTSPEGRHFYGHGAFSADGTLLYATENDVETGEGRVSVWDASAGYRRIGDFASGGVGPHEILRAPDGTLLVANGGLRTHPDQEREDLNKDSMEPNLAWLSPSGEILEIAEPPPAMIKNSLRHLSIRPDGLAAVALQWHGSARVVAPLLALHRRGETIRYLSGPDQPKLKGYAGSVAFSGDGREAAIASPPGGRAQIFDAEAGLWLRSVEAEDVCGLAPSAKGLIGAGGTGGIWRLGAEAETMRLSAERAWDNHLIPLAVL